jgi:integrase
VYVLKFRHGGKQKFLTIGKHGSPWTVETARDRARQLLGLKYNGLLDLRNAQTETVSDLCDKYIAEHARPPHKKPSSAYTDKRLIENHIRPLIGKLRIRDVTRQHAEEMHKAVHEGKTKTAPADVRQKQTEQRGGKVVSGGPGVANRCLTLLSKMFNLAEDWGLRDQNSNPARRIKRNKEFRRTRYLTDDELRRLGVALRKFEQTDGFAVAAIKLLILTGARRGEILGLRWEWVDLQRGLLLLPDSKTGQKEIRLSPAATAVLKKVPRIAGNPFVIAGAKTNCGLVNLQKPWRRICALAGINAARIHDLRHTFASIALAHGLSLSVTGALLGHARSQTTERYAHLQIDHVRRANEAVGGTILSLLTEQSEDVPISLSA